MQEVKAVRRRQNTEGVELGIYKGITLTPFCLKVGSYWRQVCVRNNGSWYIRTKDGEITIPEDLIMVLNSLAIRNADSGRLIGRLGRNQALGGKRLLDARIEATAKIKINNLVDDFFASGQSAAQFFVKERNTPKGATEGKADV